MKFWLVPLDLRNLAVQGSCGKSLRAVVAEAVSWEWKSLPDESCDNSVAEGADIEEETFQPPALSVAFPKAAAT